jgi:hypothetical protein
LFGDSGSGKTWLYKHAFSKKGIEFLTVDLAKAKTDGLDYALASALPQPRWKTIKRSADVRGSWAILDFGLKGGVKSEQEPVEVSPFDAILEYVSTTQNTSFLVFDNLEQVSGDRKILEEILSLVIQLDNSESGGSVLRFLFVGVVSDMTEIVAAHDFSGTIGNRLYELPEVDRFSEVEAEALLRRGFEDKLKVTNDSELDYYREISYLTDRNAQQLHALSFEIACACRSSGYHLTQDWFSKGVERWERSSLNLHAAQVASRMNKRDTRIQRRNQVLFAMALSDKSEFKVSDIDNDVRRLFPDDSMDKRQLGIDSIVKQLSSGYGNILRPIADGQAYRFSHPKMRPAIRMKLSHLKSESSRQRIYSTGRKGLEELGRILKGI